MKFEDHRKRVKDLRKRDYGQGEIVGYVNDGEEYWIIRWDDSGLDNEWLEAKEFKFIDSSIVQFHECKDCPRCGHPDCRHVNGLCNYASDCKCAPIVWLHSHLIAPVVKAEEFPTANDAFMIKASPNVVAKNCSECGHSEVMHEPTIGSGAGCRAQLNEDGDGYERCYCPEFTTAEQSPSYSKSVQSEQPPRYAERQASFRYQCTNQHARIVGDLLVRMVSTLKSDPPEELGLMREQLSQPLLALLRCEEVECQDARKLAGLILSNLLLE